MKSRFVFIIVLFILYQYSCVTDIVHKLSLQNYGKETLEGLYKRQKAYFNKYGRYATSFDEFDFEKDMIYPSPSYIYFLGDEKYYFKHQTPRIDLNIPDFLEKKATNNEYWIYTITNLDKDDCLEIWAINEKGEIYHISDDMQCEKGYRYISTKSK